ncbi:hypothetical protein ACFLSI_03740 [Bacteroidota bacterium]
MKTILKYHIVLLAGVFCFFTGFAQEDFNNIRLGAGNITLDNKVYKKNANYVNFGFGPAYNPKRNAIEQSYGVSYNFLIKNIAFQVGYHSCSDDYILDRSLQKVNDLHLGGGIRWEKIKSNSAVLAGFSYAYGADEVVKNDTSSYLGFTKFGLYVEYQYFYKIFFDIGVGATAFISTNGAYQVLGIRLEFYFSQAYKRPYY